MRSKLPITSEDKIWVEESFAWFFQQFGIKSFLDSPVILFPEDLLPSYHPEEFPDSKSIIEAFCTKLSIPLAQINFEPIYRGEIDKYGLYSGIAGSYASYINPKNFTELYWVSLNMEEHVDLQEILGTLIHEFCHVKLLGENRISVYESPDQEYLTDLLTIYWGFGVIAANNAFYSHGEYYGDSQFMVNIMGGKGYLPLEIWAYSLALYAILKEEPEIIWPNALGREMRPLFDRCLGYLNSHDLPFSLKDFSSDGIPPDPLKRNLLDSSDKAKLLEIDHGLLTIHSNENLYRRAEQNFKLNLLLPASQDYFQLMQKETNNPRALSGIAKTLLRARQLSDCQGYLDKVFELDKHYEEARITQGHLHLLTYNLSSAIEILTPLPQTPLHASEGHHIMGMIAYEQGETPTAFVEMEAALSLRPTYAQLHLTIGIMHLDQRKFDQAENHIDQARELNPKLYVAYTYKGILLRKKNQFDSAISYLEKALEVNPYDEQAQWHLALTENRARCIEGNEWMEVYHFSDLVAALPIRRKLKKGGIKFKIRDENTINFTASTNIDKCILIREENVEKALDLIGSNILGWEEYAF